MLVSFKFSLRKKRNGEKNQLQDNSFCNSEKARESSENTSYLLPSHPSPPSPWFNIMCCSARYRCCSWQTLSMKLTTRLIFARAGKSAAARSIRAFVFAHFVSGANIYGRRCTAHELVKSAALMISVVAWYWLTDWLCTHSLKVGVRSGGGKVSEVSQKKGKRRESAVNKKENKRSWHSSSWMSQNKNISGFSFRTKVSHDQTKRFIHPGNFSLWETNKQKKTSHLLVAC